VLRLLLLLSGTRRRCVGMQAVLVGHCHRVSSSALCINCIKVGLHDLAALRGAEPGRYTETQNFVSKQQVCATSCFHDTCKQACAP
jgi:hypothetical protein